MPSTDTSASREPSYDENIDIEDELRPQTRNLVPLAERPFAPADYTETARETVWYNPGDKPAQLDVYVGHGQTLPHPARLGRKLNWEEMYAKRRYVIPPKGRRAIPSEFDAEIQRFECMETQCSQNKFGCKSFADSIDPVTGQKAPGHRYMIVGGLNPHLQREGMQFRPMLAPALDDLKAKEAEHKQKLIESLVQQEQGKSALAAAQAEVARLQAELAKREADAKGLDVKAEASASKAKK